MLIFLPLEDTVFPENRILKNRNAEALDDQQVALG